MKSTIVFAVCVLLITGCSGADGKNNVTNNGTNNGTNVTNNGTSNGGGIDPADYDQSCAVDSDCMLILSGDPCGCGPCLDAAINVSEQSAYRSDKAAGMCEEIACPAIACGDEQLPWCNAGTCEVRVAKRVAADDFDRSCSVDSDCVLVYEGEVCDCRACGNAAINVGDQEAYESAFDVACESGLDCACAPSEVFCNDGVCELAQ